ncbi:N-formylglutamate deformylase [Thioclava sp. IC9]|uniref:N-formylglutamate deformylase n=1 Tax=Thioclava sp. IC9 TaxID=1973007 RepID=UPI000B543788|nr:N-formylglutamate deformylase [Thioclava sp. IC9]OWX98638.1 N-formylglutamate deformylase [Thioclava sp. IC9]
MTSIAPDPVEITEGESPVILGLPHTGTWVPADVREALNDRGRALADTDWNIHELYAGLLPGATSVRATFHRYVIDANRGPENESLYPGQNTTGLVPLTDFDGAPIWTTEPAAEEITHRLAEFHTPYHAALRTQIERVRARHGVAILYDCHSIRSHIPFLFDGKLPDFNIGTANGTSCDPRIETVTAEICARADGFSHVINGRFRGGWTTRNYGQPESGVHAIQMELAQSTHLAAEAPPWDISAEKAARLRPHLGEILRALEMLASELVA